LPLALPLLSHCRVSYFAAYHNDAYWANYITPDVPFNRNGVAIAVNLRRFDRCTAADVPLGNGGNHAVSPASIWVMWVLGCERAVRGWCARRTWAWQCIEMCRRFWWRGLDAGDRQVSARCERQNTAGGERAPGHG
jgi:hypothetical protein